MPNSAQDAKVTLTCIRFRNDPPQTPLSVELGKAGGTIGRASNNSLVIPDPEHYASRQHAQILFDANDTLLIKNNSNNGTIINDSLELEIDETHALKEGDVVLVGECYIKISISVPPDPKLDDSIDDAFRDIFGELDTQEASNPGQTNNTTKPDPANTTNANHEMQENAAKTVASSSPDDTYTIDSEAIDVFLEQLQIDPTTLNEDIVKVMGIAGGALHTFTEGVIEILKARNTVKKSFAMDVTKIQGVKNNALKFSVSSEQALSRLLNEEPGFLSPLKSVEEAVNDAKAHQVAMVSGMTAAIQTILSRFDPDELEKELAEGFSFSSKKARYWEAYRESYKQIAEESENNFNELFAEEFRKTYEDQVRKLKEPKT